MVPQNQLPYKVGESKKDVEITLFLNKIVLTASLQKIAISNERNLIFTNIGWTMMKTLNV